MNTLHKLYLIEGLPGIGKSTYADNLKETLTEDGHRVILFQEGDLHPADMAWNAYLSMEEYNEFIANVISIWETIKTPSKEDLLEHIKSQTLFEDGHAIIAYTKLGFNDPRYKSLYDDLSAREIYDGKLSLAEFMALLKKRWHAFSKKALNTTNTIYIFECAFLQNQIFELMGFYDMEDEEIMNYLFSLLDMVHSLNPSLIYLAPNDVDALIEATDLSRKGSDSWPGWMDQMVTYVEKSNYGKLHGLKGIDGVFEFLKNRYRLDRLFLSEAEGKDIPLTISIHTRCFS